MQLDRVRELVAAQEELVLRGEAARILRAWPRALGSKHLGTADLQAAVLREGDGAAESPSVCITRLVPQLEGGLACPDSMGIVRTSNVRLAPEVMPEFVIELLQLFAGMRVGCRASQDEAGRDVRDCLSCLYPFSHLNGEKGAEPFVRLERYFEFKGHRIQRHRM